MRSSTTYRVSPISTVADIGQPLHPTASQLKVHLLIGIWAVVYEPQPSDCHRIMRPGKCLECRSLCRVPYLLYPYVPVAGPNKHSVFGCIVGPVLNSR